MRKIIIPCLLLGAGLAIGVLVDRQWLSSSDPHGTKKARLSAPSPSISEHPSTSKNAKWLRPTPSRIVDDFAEAAAAILHAQNIKNRIQQCERLKTLADEIDPSLYPRLKEMVDMIRSYDAKLAFASELVSNWARVDGLHAAESIQSLPSNELKKTLLLSLCEVWLDENSGAAADWILNKTQIASHEDLYDLLISHLASTDTDKAFSVLNSLRPSPSRNHLLQTLFSEWSSREPAAAAERLLTLKRTDFRDCMDKVLSKWARQDFQKAWAWANALPQKFDRFEAIRQLCVGMGDESPRNAIESAQKSLGADSGREAIYQIVNNWAASDLGSARAWVESLPNGSLKENALQSLISEWAVQDSRGAAAYVKSIPPGSSRDSMIAALAREGARQDPMATMEMLKGLGGQDAVRNGLEFVMETWARNDPSAAAAYLTAFPAGPQRANAIGNVISSWVTKDLPATLNFIKGLSASEQKAAGTSLVQGLTESNPQLAAAYAAEFQVESDTYGNIAREWANADLDSALAWAKNLKDAKTRNYALQNLQNQWVESDPKGMANYLKSVEESPSRSGLIKGLAGIWSLSDLNSVMGWAASLESEPDRIEAHSAIVSNWAQDNPGEAARFGASLPPGQEQDKVAAAVIQQWSQSDPANAAKWAANFPPGDTRDEAFQTIASAWANSDAKAAADWVNTLPSSSAREAAIGELADALGRSEPHAGLQWAAKITDPEKRLESTKGIFRVWMMDDPLHASEQVRNSSLSEADKSELLIKPTNRPGNVHYSNGNKIIF